MTFVDTSFWVALQFRDDANHRTARTLWARPREAMLTTNHVMGETWTFLRRRLGFHPALEFFKAATRIAALTMIHVEDAAEREAWNWLARHDERSYSFVDSTSFAVMRRRRVREALAFDGDFSAAGFVELR